MSERRIVGDYVATRLKNDPMVWVYEPLTNQEAKEFQSAEVAQLAGATSVANAAETL